MMFILHVGFSKAGLWFPKSKAQLFFDFFSPLALWPRQMVFQPTQICCLNPRVQLAPTKNISKALHFVGLSKMLVPASTIFSSILLLLAIVTRRYHTVNLIHDGSMFYQY